MPSTDEELAFAPATELRGQIADGTVSPVEITELYLSRIERLDPQLNSYLTVTAEQAMEGARKAEQAVARGDELGPLHGIPISIKDLQMTAGVRTTGGSLAYKDRVPDANCAVVERVLAAGAVMLGKTNTSEFGLLGATENRLGGPCRNPWDTARISGGSSGGAGASLAAGLCSLATGSDGGGSIRIPASFSGVYGIKPTQGRVSGYSGLSGPASVNLISQNGPMSRTVRDSALLLQVMAGHDPRDHGSMREPVPDFQAAAGRGVEGLRIAWSKDYGYVAVEPEVATIAQRAASLFQELGCTVEETDLCLDGTSDTWLMLFAADTYLALGHLLDDPSDPLTWYARRTIEAGATYTASDYEGALVWRDGMIQQFAELFEDYDLLLSPTMAVTAFPVDNYPEPAPGPGWSVLSFTHPINAVGLPAASVPCGFDSNGLPVGLQIVGRRGDEETVIAASAAFEQARPWAHHRPAVS
jgi:Asp-tRNA(Asn)/Glu-tRNA(Gln) amidotransferase A subunit family amidase